MKILFSTSYIPYKKAKLFEDNIDFYYYRNTLKQGFFQLKQVQSWHSLHFLAQNLPVDSVIIENPTFKKFKTEIINNKYDIVALCFTIVTADRLLEMITWIKEFYPKTEVIIGGYGTAILSEQYGIEKEIRRLADYICYGDGLSSMQNYLKERHNIDSEMPLKQYLLPIEMCFFRSRIRFYKTLNFISSLGCNYKCSFCATSAQFKKKIELFSGRELYNAIKENTKIHKKAQSGVIFNEDFLADREQIIEFMNLMEQDTELIKRPFLLTVFSSAKSISQYTLSELIRCGIGMIYIGVESFNSDILQDEHLVKREKDLINIKTLFDELNSAGIHTLGSIIVGWDNQTKEMAQDELMQFVKLNPTMYQVMPLQALPGTALWCKMKKESRIIPDFEYKNLRLERSTFVYQHFTQEESVSMIYDTYKKLVDFGGPWPFRMYENLRRGITTMQKLDGLEFKQRFDAYRKLTFPLHVFSIISGLFFWGGNFRKKWNTTMSESFFNNPFVFCLATLMAILSTPVLIIIVSVGSIRHYLLPNGDQPKTIRMEYKNCTYGNTNC